MENGVSAKDIQNQLHQLADPTIAAHSQRFFKTGKGEYGEGDIFLGIRVPVLRKTAGKYKNVSLHIVTDLLASQYHEERLLALIFLVDRYQKSPPHDRQTIYRLYMAQIERINNWDLVDSSAPHIVGAYLYDKDRQPLYDLAASRNLWQRRIAIMSTFYFIRRHDFTDAFNISELLLTDPHELIHQAVGWMLREIGKRELVAEEAFLKTRYKQMPRTMLRYAIEKFEEKKRKGYLKGII